MNKVETGEIVVYQPDEITRLEVRVEGETVWLTQLQMAELFGRDRTVITKHIRNIFTEQELDEESNVQILHFANSDKPVKLFSLDVIISVGYRVKSIQGTRFRQWANSVIKEYLVRGYSVSQRLISIERRLDDHERKMPGRAGHLLSDEVGHDRFLLDWVRDAGCAACFDAFEQPCHVAAKLSHNLHSLLVLEDLLRSVAVYHVPVL